MVLRWFRRGFPQFFLIFTMATAGTLFAQNKTPLNKTTYYLHGRIYTNDPQHPWAVAMAIRDEKILCIGTLAHVLLDCGGAQSEAETIQLNDQFVMPGFNDAHTHLGGAGRDKLNLSLNGVDSIAELQRLVKETVAKKKIGEWVLVSGWSISFLPKALRWAAWCVAFTTATRIPAAVPITQSRRVWPTISMIVGTPRPGSPTIRAQAPCSSISEEALEWLPSLSFRRWMWNALRPPSGRMRGSRKQERPSSVWSSTRNMSDIGAEQNHLCPISSYSPPAPPPPNGCATVVLARTSEPPCFSVIAMP